MTGVDKYEPGCSPVDVNNAYRLFLGREPEQAYASVWSSATELARHFINSEEFDVDVAQSMLRQQFPAPHRFVGEPDLAIRLWIGSFLPVSKRSRRRIAQVKQWQDALRLLFSDATFTKSVAVDNRKWTLDLLAGRLADQKNGRKTSSAGVRRTGRLRHLAVNWMGPRGGSSRSTISAAEKTAAELQAELVRDMSNGVVGDTDHMTASVQAIASSLLFDPKFYARAAGLETTDYGLARHYLLVGEAQGLKPSLKFDPNLYNERHPDVRDAGFNTVLHYEVAGKHEGRGTEFLAEKVVLSTTGIDRSKSTILLVCHEASRTGAPVLGWNLATELSAYHNVVVVLLDGGSLESAFAEVAAAVVGPVRNLCPDPFELRALAKRLVTAYNPLYVIGNSVESGPVVRGLREVGVPLVLLVHEFSSHSIPRGILLKPLYAAADHIVFPAPLVAQSSFDDYRHILLQNVHILPQGPSRIPPAAPDHERLLSSKATAYARGPWFRKAANNLLGLWRLIRGGAASVASAAPPTVEGGVAANAILARSGSWMRRSEKDFVVIGLGTVDLRKGVDLFLATATSLRRIAPELTVRFVWIGHDPSPLSPYQVLLQEQVKRGGLEDSFEIVDAVDDLEPVYDAADVLFMSSRLDPLPNVAIDAVLRGVPVVCFENATGMAEFLALDEHTAHLAVPYLDTGAAAEVLAVLGRDEGQRNLLGARLSARAKKTFDMPRYAERLNELGLLAAKRADATAAGASLLSHQGNFDPALYAAREAQTITREALIKRFLDDSRKVAFAGGPVQGQSPRRPLAGFHPMAYASEYPGFPSDSSANPLVHFLEEGRPEGSWKHPCIRIESQPQAKSKLATVLHGHFHYTDNFNDFLNALQVNLSRIDLILTTNSTASGKYLKKMCRRYSNGSVTIRVMPNIGRDIGPFLELLSEGVFNAYDVVGHVHGKRSLHTMDWAPDLGERWRVFLWEHLLGTTAPVADIILQAMEDDVTLGLVFPENPDLVGWEENLPIAEELAERMNLSRPLPVHVDFPVGTMFWARPAALLPFVKAGFTAVDYPKEPLPIDGTMLHAIERLLTPATIEAGYRFASTYNSRVVRW